MSSESSLALVVGEFRVPVNSKTFPGGTEKAAYQNAMALADIYDQVIFLAANFSYPIAKPNVTLINAPDFQKGKPYYKVLEECLSPFRLPDAIVCHTYRSGIRKFLINKYPGIPLVIYEHNKPGGFLSFGQAQKAHTFPIWAINSTRQAEIWSKLTTRVNPIQPGRKPIYLPVTYIEFPEPEAFDLSNKYSLTFLGRPERNLKAILKILPNLCAKVLNICVPYADPLLTEFLEYKGAIQINIIVEPTRNQISRILKTTGIHLNPFRGESFGLATLEASSFGVPTVSLGDEYKSPILEHSPRSFICPTLSRFARQVNQILTLDDDDYLKLRQDILDNPVTLGFNYQNYLKEWQKVLQTSVL